MFEIMLAAICVSFAIGAFAGHAIGYSVAEKNRKRRIREAVEFSRKPHKHNAGNGALMSMIVQGMNNGHRDS